jgi:porin
MSIRFTGGANYEAFFEICYTAQIKSGWTLQPDFQYIVHPGGNVPNTSGTGAVKDASVFGVCTRIFERGNPRARRSRF